MAKKLFYFFFICLITAFAAEPANAQKWLKNAGKGLQRATTRTPAVTAGVKTAGTVARIESAVTRAIASSHPHLYIGGQRWAGASKFTAIRNTLKAGYQPHRYFPRPKLQEDKAFTVKDFTEIMLSGADVTPVPPSLPFQNQCGLIYRGLALNADGKAIRNILENGLRVQDSGSESNTLRIAYASRGGWDAVQTVMDPIINLTSGPTSATNWAGKRMTPEDIRVVVVVRSPRTDSIIVETEDIPVSKIYAVTALLNINGTRTWCKVELEGDGFRVTPYEPFVGTPQP